MTSITTPKEAFINSCFNEYKSTIRYYGVSISEEGLKSIEALLNAFYDSLEGKLAAKIYLNTLPPGFGKTEAIASFIKVWKENGFHPAGGILVGLQTKNEIEALVKRLDLAPEDVAVLTRDEEINALGSGDANTAPVLITTQQMIIRRTADRSFAAAREFHYQALPRALRIWDESYLPAKAIDLSLYDLQRLPSRLHRHFGSLVEHLNALAMQVRDAGEGDIVNIPGMLLKAMPAVREMQLQGRLKLAPDELLILEKLELAAGRSMVVKSARGSSNRMLIGSSRPLPDDLLPLIVTDASGRVRGTYDLMDQARGNLVRLPSAGADYSNLKIHLMSRASGKDALADPDGNWPIYRHVVAEMLRRPGRWLVISYKADHQQDVETAIKEALGGSVEFDFLHWGAHHGTNAFKDVENIVVIGSYFYPDDSYRALAIAATGLPVGEMLEYDNSAFRADEFKHNMYQAILRGSARKADAGVASPCKVFIVASPKNDAGELLAQTFPGATIEPWGEPRRAEHTRHEKALIDAIDALLPVGVQEVSKKKLGEYAGFSTKQELGRQLRRAAVLKYLASERIKIAHKKLYRVDEV